MTRRFVVLLVVFAVLLTAFSFALSLRDSRDWRANRSRRLLPFPWQDAAAVIVTRHGGQTLRFSRSPGAEWRVELHDGRLDVLDSKASDGLAALATLTRRDPMPDRAPPDPDAAVTLVATSSQGQEVRLDFGDVQNNIRAVVVDGDDSLVYGVNQDLLTFLEWKGERLRNMYLTSVGGGRAPEKVTLSPNPDDPSLDVVLERRSGGWLLSQPVEWPADTVKMDLLLRWLDRLRADSVAEEAPATRAAFGLKQPTARIEALYNVPEGTLKRKIDFGAVVGTEGVYAAVDGREPVFIVPKELLTEIFMGIAQTHPVLWRNFYRKRSVNALGDGIPVSFRIERLLPTPAVLVMAAEAATEEVGGEWLAELRDESGVSHFPVEAPDPGKRETPLRALMAALSEVRIQTFLADVPPGPTTGTWTSNPAWRLSCRFADGTESPVLTLYAEHTGGEPLSALSFARGEGESNSQGGAEQSGVVFSLSNRPAVFRAYAQEAERLCLPLYKYRSRRLLRLDTGQFEKVSVEIGKKRSGYFRKPGDVNEQWWTNPDAPEPLMDDNNHFVVMLDELSMLETEAFVADAEMDMTEFGLDQPEITAIVYRTSGSADNPSASDIPALTLDVGKPVANNRGRYARLNRAGPVFLLSERMARALVAEYR